MGPLLSTDKLEKEIRMSISRILPFCLGGIQFRYKASRRSWLIQRSLRGGLYASCGKAGLMVYVTAGLIWRYQQQNSARVEHVMNVGASSNLHASRMLRYIYIYIWSFVWPCLGNHLDSQPDQKNWLRTRRIPQTLTLAQWVSCWQCSHVPFPEGMRPSQK